MESSSGDRAQAGWPERGRSAVEGNTSSGMRRTSWLTFNWGSKGWGPAGFRPRGAAGLREIAPYEIYFPAGPTRAAASAGPCRMPCPIPTCLNELVAHVADVAPGRAGADERLCHLTYAAFGSGDAVCERPGGLGLQRGDRVGIYLRSASRPSASFGAVAAGACSCRSTLLSPTRWPSSCGTATCACWSRRRPPGAARAPSWPMPGPRPCGGHRCGNRTGLGRRSG